MTEPSDIDDQRARREEPVAPQEAEPLAPPVTGNVGAQGLTILAVAVIVILAVVLYGLNGPQETTPPTPSQTAAESHTTGPSTTPAPPQNGGK